MKTVGIIVEYNPFHNGHKYHIEKTKELTGAQGVVALMSGNFVQRGEPALCDKYTRAKSALLGGADLVVELPCLYSCQSAEYFAKGAVEILEAMKCDFISFGMEEDNLQKLQKIAKKMQNPDYNFKQKIDTFLKSGDSYPKAIAKATGSDAINTPNNILAIEYLKAIKTMTPIGIKRQGSEHDGKGSASDIRAKLLSEENIESLVPKTTYDILKTAKLVDKDALNAIVLYKLRSMSAEEISLLPDVTEGLENRIKEACNKALTLEELLELVKTKRYTMARLRRICTNALLGIKKTDLGQNPQYIKVLGMNNTGMKIIDKLKKDCPLPLIVKTADADMCNMLKRDLWASDIYSILTGVPGNKDYLTSPIVIK